MCFGQILGLAKRRTVFGDPECASMQWIPRGMHSRELNKDIPYQSIEEGRLYPQRKHSTTSKIAVKFREMAGCVGWGLVALSILYIVYYFSLSWIVCPVLLFVVFLASGGPSFPRVFFRTFYRDIRATQVLICNLVKSLYMQYKKQTIVDLFIATANKYPHKAALQFEGRTWTFRELDEYSNRIANIFKSKGYVKGDVVALFMENRPEYIFIWLGLAKIGVISSLINFNLRLDSLLHCITVSNSKGLVFSSDYSDAIFDILDKLPESMQYFSCGGRQVNSKIHCNSLEQDLRHASCKRPIVDFEKSYTDVILYIFTSGTTGLPKPAFVRTTKFILASGCSYVFNVGHKDILYCPLPLYHSSAGVIAISLCARFGTTLVLRSKFSASRFFDDCVEYKATMILYIGELCRYLLAQPPRPSDTQHAIRIAMGNGLRPKVWPEFQSRFKIKTIGEFYGSTEGNCSLLNTDNTVGACGFTSMIFPKVFPIKLIRVDKSTGEILRDKNGIAIDCKPGEPGLMVGKIIKGSTTFRFDGYLNKSETAKKIASDVFSKGDQAFLSGDILVQDEYGYVYFQDRTGDTFRWRGENVSTTEVESVISKVFGMRDVVVYGVEIPGIEGRAGMVFIVNDDDSLDIGSLASKIEPVLPTYARPIFVRLGQAVQLTGTFKFQKSKLKEEGFDINIVKDDLYYYDSKSKSYLTLDENMYGKIINGNMRF